MTKAKKLTDAERIDAIIALIKLNGWTLPVDLGGVDEAEPKADPETE